MTRDGEAWGISVFISLNREEAEAAERNGFDQRSGGQNASGQRFAAPSTGSALVQWSRGDDGVFTLCRLSEITGGSNKRGLESFPWPTVALRKSNLIWGGRASSSHSGMPLKLPSLDTDAPWFAVSNTCVPEAQFSQHSTRWQKKCRLPAAQDEKCF